MYAPNGNISFNTNITNVNGRLFADSFTFSGSQLNVTGSDSDWELLGTDNIITKTYSSDEEFSEGIFDNTESVNEGKLSLVKTDDFNGEKVKEYNVELCNNQITVKETVSKEFITYDNGNVDVKLSFLSGGTSRYKLINEGVTWSQAKERCENLGGHLVTISDENEWNIVKKIFEDNNGGKYHLWMGGFYDASESKWKWVDGTPFVFTNWDAGEPNREYGNGQYEDYLMCYRVPNPYNSRSVAYKWNDLYNTGLSSGIFTTGNYCYICEWDDGSTADNLTFSTTVKNINNIDIARISPEPESITEKADGSAAIVWKNISEEVIIPFISADTAEDETVLLYDSVISSENNSANIETTSVQVKSYGGSDKEFVSEGSWETVYDSECDGTVWSEVFWNGILYDDSKIIVQIAVSDNGVDFSEFINVRNHGKLADISGRYIKLRVTEKIASTGKSPELYDISLYSMGASCPGYTNYPPDVTINDSEKCFTDEYILINTEAFDDSINSELTYNWICENEDVEFKEDDKPYARIKFKKSGDYIVNLEVSDGTSSARLQKIITVLDRPDTDNPVIEPDPNKKDLIVHVSKDTEDIVNPGDQITISVSSEDGDIITKSELRINGEEVLLTDGKYVFYAEEGAEYIVEYIAEDEYGNVGRDVTNISVKTFSDEDNLGPNVLYKSHSVLLCGQPAEFEFTGDSTTEKLTVRFNGEYAELDGNGSVTYTPQETGTVIIDVHAENAKGKPTDFQLTAEVINLSFSGRTEYKDNEPAEFTVQISDNYTFADKFVLINGKRYEIDENGKVTAKKLEIGDYKAVLYLVSKYNETINTEIPFRIVDTTPPNATIRLENTDIKTGDTAIAVIEASDNTGIKEITATVNGNEYVVLENNTIVIENISTGKHIIKVTVKDYEGNGCISSYEFIVSDDKQHPLSLKANAEYDENKIISVKADVQCADNNYEVYGTINGEELAFTDNVAKYQAEAGKEYDIVVTAENGYTKAVSTMKISIPEDQPEYEFKIDAVADRTEVNVDEPVNISVKSNSLTGSFNINYSADGGKIVLEDGCFVFTSSVPGSYTVKFSVVDSKGRSAEDTVVITVGRVDDGSEITESYVNTYTPEPRARVILDSNEKTETKMTEEMADLADHLKTPLAVYEYLYNNVNVEFYTGSRKGAIGTYEQNGGNDVDCASLLVAMLRYLGYDAEYVTGKIGITEKQLLELTGTNSIDDALNIIGIHFKSISKSANYYYFTHTWVRTVINGESHDIDISFKKYKHVLSLNDAAEYANKNYSTDEMLGFTDIRTYQNFFNDEMIANPDAEFSFSGRSIVQKAIKELPSRPNYIQTNEPEIVSNICDSKVILRDKVTFTISGESKEYYSTYLYSNDLTIGYTFNPDDLELMEMLEFPYPNSVYGLINAYYITGVRLDASPAIYINNKIDYTWNEATSVIDSNDLKITVFSSGITLDYEKTIEAGCNKEVFKNHVKDEYSGLKIKLPQVIT